MFAEKLEKYVNEGKALNEARNEHKKVPGLSRAGGGGGAGGDFSGMKGLDKPFKAGGIVSSASKRADGCAIKGKTRGRIV
jgi:hypothetical protein